MKERPILMSAPMVRAILEGRKTVTRRIVKPQPSTHGVGGAGFHPATDLSCAAWVWRSGYDGSIVEMFKRDCPYGVAGDRLWVREAFMHEPADYCWEASVSIPCRPASTVYRADFPECDKPQRGVKWSPSIFMPRSLSRLLLEVTEVRVERLQDISEADAIAEGTPCYVCGGQLDGRSESDCHCFHRRATPNDYRVLWESINGAGSWEANPFVWVVSFRRIDHA